MEKIHTINGDEVKSVKVIDFVVNPNYEVIRTPDTMVNFGLIFPKWKPYGHYSVSEVAYGGWIVHDEDYIKRIGLVIHDNKVCWPPCVVVYYKDGSKSVFKYSTYDEAKNAHDIIASKIPNAITI